MGGFAFEDMNICGSWSVTLEIGSAFVWFGCKVEKVLLVILTFLWQLKLSGG